MQKHQSLVRGNGVKKTVNARRINKEWMRHKLAKASFIYAPRLVKA
jgi:hypothetical protein